MDAPSKPKNPAGRQTTAVKRPKKKISAAEERQAAALAKIAKNFRKVNVADRRHGPQFLFVLLALLGVALVLYKMFGPGLWREDSLVITDVAPEPESGGAIEGPIDPTPFRDNLVHFESLLLGQASATDLASMAESISRTGGKLASQLELDTRFTASQRLARSLQSLLDELAAKSPPKLEDFAKLRQSWLSLRRRELQTADFFLSGEAAVAADRLTLAAYRSQLRDLDQALVSALEKAAALGVAEPGESADDQAARAVALEEVAGHLRQELDGLQRRLPARPTGDLSPNLMVAIQSLEQALADSRRLAARSANLKPESRAAFAGVQQLIDRTRIALDQLDG